MRRHNSIKYRVSGKSVFLEREKVVVTVMLETRCHQEQREAEKGPQGGNVGYFDFFQGDFLRLKSSC